MRDPHQPDLFDGAPPARDPPNLKVGVDAPPAGRTTSPVLILPFPLVARVGKVRDVAAKLVATRTERHAESYRSQVTEALRVHLVSKRVPTALHAAELRQFWQAVDLEVARLLNPSRRPGGGVA